MREVDRRGKYSRRIFLQGAASAVPVVAVAASAGIGIEDAWAADATTLTPATLKTLVKVARDIYPHDMLVDSYYITAIKPWDAKALLAQRGARAGLVTHKSPAYMYDLVHFWGDGVPNGGTGQTTLPTNGIVYGQGTSPVATAVGAAGQVLTGTAGAPACTRRGGAVRWPSPSSRVREWSRARFRAAPAR